jgi:hypothetical protein
MKNPRVSKMTIRLELFIYQCFFLDHLEEGISKETGRGYE